SLDEAIFLRKEEEEVMWDLCKKTYDEFQKANYSNEIILSYIGLIFTYTQSFYDRQFATRSKTYNNVISEFYSNLKDYFKSTEDVSGLPSVSYFAKKSFLSPNYFGDV